MRGAAQGLVRIERVVVDDAVENEDHTAPPIPSTSEAAQSSEMPDKRDRGTEMRTHD
jgi:hypothetical protein